VRDLNKNQIEDAISTELQNRPFEEILEDFDLTPTDVMWALYCQGLIDDELLDTLYGSYEG
jgi:uncharacterized protein (DUF433 family)